MRDWLTLIYHNNNSLELIMLILIWIYGQVRKEKLGDRITALQQLVSPFGKVFLFLYVLCFTLFFSLHSSFDNDMVEFKPLPF